jgi:hypothetical protein
MEEFVYDYFLEHPSPCNYIYIPVFWTNLQNHPGFHGMKEKYNVLLRRAYDKEIKLAMELHKPLPKYFTVVQHDDGVLLELPYGTLVFGACAGVIPLPLIYEDITYHLNTQVALEKTLLASFVGSITHPVRTAMMNVLKERDGIICQTKDTWTVSIPRHLADSFVDLTLRSKFCLAPRGYGRSSFRFFEAIQLGTIPVYFWDDKKWLPYQDTVDYSMFSICIQEKDISHTYEILSGVSEVKYGQMMTELKRIQNVFRLEWMCEYIKRRLTS